MSNACNPRLPSSATFIQLVTWRHCSGFVKSWISAMTVGNECWVTVTCIVDPSNDGATISSQVTRVNLVRVVFLYNFRQTSTHKCGLELGLRNTQVSKRRNSRFSHHETALDRLIVVQETEIGDSTESRFGCITKEVGLSVNW